MTIPSSLAGLTIPTDSLRDLPEGAAYVARSGQAGLRLEVRDKRLYATATCDSLQRQVFHLEEELHQARDSLRQEQVETRPAVNPFKYYLDGVLSGVILAIASYLFIKYARKKWQNIS